MKTAKDKKDRQKVGRKARRIKMKSSKKRKSPSVSPKVEEIIKIWRPRSNSLQTDVLGSYTGTSEFDDKRPIQDADDL